MERKSNLYNLTVTAVISALLAVIAPYSLPIGPVGITLCTLILYLAPYLLGWQHATLATFVYIMLGLIGLPVFTNFEGGLGKLAGPTGGYILGYIPLVLIAGLFIHFFPRQRVLQLLGMVLATAVLYTFGTAWFCVLTGKGLLPALSVCVIPFLPGDLAKIGFALALGPILLKRLCQAGLYPNTPRAHA